jgi:uncharacterized protein (TIGR00251 family)
MKITNARGGAAITVKVTPRAPRTEVSGLMDDGTLKIRLAAPPTGGAANKLLVEFLSQLLDLPRGQIDIIAGETSERKLISLIGISPREVDAAVRRVLGGRGSASHPGGKPDARKPGRN